jgi:hypothetical protein
VAGISGKVRACIVAGAATAMAATALVAQSAPAGAGDARPPDDRLAAVARFGHTMTAFGATTGGRAGVQASVSGTGWVSETDPAGDVDARADVTNVSARVRAGRVRFGLQLPTTPDPRVDDSWQNGATFAAWVVDTNADDQPDYDVFVLAFPADRFVAGVITDDGTTYLCNGNASYVAARHTFSATVPLRCIGSPTSIAFQGGSQYDTSPFDDVFDVIQDFAPDNLPLVVAADPATAVLGGGVLTDSFGNLRTFATAGTAPTAASSFFATDIVRGLAIGPDGGTGYLLDGFGGLHPLGVAQNGPAVRTVGGPYWPGWDIARGVSIAASGRGGYLLDAYGGLHQFAIGDVRALPAVVGGPYWPGWDITRGVALLPDGRGGFVLDGFGGLHWFSLGTARPAPTIVGAPYWNGWDIARGITITPDGTAGYITDGVGALHPFGIGGATSLPAAGTGPFAARGVGVFPTALKLPADAPTGP